MEKRLLHRRSFLRGAGSVAVGLPFLEAFASKKAFAAPPKRLAIYFQSNGVNMDRWWPSDYGAITAETMKGRAVEPLAKHASKLLIPRGIFMSPRGYGIDGGGGCDHVRGMGQKLTCAFISGTRAQGPSIDHVIAKGLNPNGRDPIVLGMGGSGSGKIGSAFFKESGQAADFQRDPLQAFSGLMGMATPGGAEAVAKTLERRKSVLDVVRGDLMSMQSDTFLSGTDKKKLQMHFDAIRQLETSMAPGAAGASAACGVAPAKPDEGSSFEQTAVQMTNLMALVLACNANNVISLQTDRGSGGTRYSWLPDGLNKKYGHHPLSHGATFDAATSPNLPTDQYKQALLNIDTWHMKMYANLLDKLASYSEPGGSVLDNSVVLYMNELSDGLKHSYLDLPVLIAGGGGKLKQGEYIKMAASTSSKTDCPTNQLFVTVAHALDYVDPATKAPMKNFGKFANGKEGPFPNLFRA